MGDEVAVSLTAIDNVSGPSASAAEGLQNFSSAIDLLGASSSNAGQSALYAASGINAAAESSNASLIPHRAAHQALALISSDLTLVAGGSKVAEAGVKVLDSVMFQMAMTGGMVSGGFIAVVAAVVAVGSALKSAYEETAAQTKAMDEMTKSAIEAAKHLVFLDAPMRSVLGVGAAEAATKVRDLQEKIDAVTKSMKENAAAVQAGVLGGTTGGFKGLMSEMAGLMTGNLVGQSGSGAANAAQVKMAGELDILKEKLKEAKSYQDSLTASSGAYKQVLADTGNPLTEYTKKMELSAQQMKNNDATLYATGLTYQQVGAWADKMGMDTARAFDIIVKQEGILKSATESLAKDFGTTLGNAISGAKNAWQDGLKTMIGAVFDAATQVVLAAAVMNEAISAALIPGSFVGILGMVVVLQAMKQVAMAALTSASSSANAAGASAISSSPSSAAGSAAPATSTGAGGNSISSAQSQVTNIISVNIPIEAMDLSSVADIQLKDLANRVGRILADASGQGQFSLVGA